MAKAISHAGNPTWSPRLYCFRQHEIYSIEEEMEKS